MKGDDRMQDESVMNVEEKSTSLCGGDIQIKKILSDTGDWIVDWSGVRRMSSRGRIETACTHPIVPVGRLNDVSTGMTKTKILYCRRGQLWSTIIVERGVLASAKRIIALADRGIAVTSNSAPFLVDYLNDMQERHYFDLEEELCVSNLGYVPNIGFAPYVKSILVDADVCFDSIYHAIAEAGDMETWINTAKACRAMSTEARIMLAGSFASPLISVVGALPFYVHIWGVDSGTGKTVALMLAASVWGNPDLGKYIQTHNATQVGQERIAAYLNQIPYCIDELQLASNGKGAANVDVYQLAQGVGRSRGKRVGGVETTLTWRCTFLSTGESPLTSNNAGAGAINRVIEIEAKPGRYIIKDGHKVSDELRHNYGFAGKLFVEKMFSSNEEQEAARESYRQNYSALVRMHITDKQAMAAATLLTADQLATKWIYEDENMLTCEDIYPYLASKSDVSAGKRAYDWLCGWVAANCHHFYRGTQIPQGTTYGVIKDAVACIIRPIFNQVLQNAGFSPNATLSYLRANGLLIIRENKGYTKTKRINGITTDCVWLVYQMKEENNE